MNPERRKEDLQISYISALCAVIGAAYETQRHDEDSTDGIIKKRISLSEEKFFDSSIRIQLKATSSSSQYRYEDDAIVYRLKVKNYNDLCTPATTPIILGLLILPDNEAEWLDWTEEEILIRGCMYWLDLSGYDKSDNKETVVVRIPKQNVINQDSLNMILEELAKEG